MIIPFSLITKSSKVSSVIGFPIDGDLIVLDGQTASIPAGSVKRYNDVIIRSGGVLRITGTAGAWTELGITGNLICDGTIVCRSGYDGEPTHTGGTFSKASSAFGFGTLSYSIVQRNGGAGASGAAYTVGGAGLGGAQNLGRGGGGGGGGSAAPGYKGGNGGAAGSNGQSTSMTIDGKTGPSVIGIATGGTGGGLVDGGNASTSVGGNGAGGGGGGGFYEYVQSNKGGGSSTVAVTCGSGGGGGYRGHHGSGLTIYVAGVLSGSGLIACSGRTGFSGGAGAAANNGNINGGSGGGGAGGSGGKLLIKYKNIGRYISFSVAGGSGGTGGSNGAAGDSGALTLTKII